jgi:hypothetical protein
MQWSNAMNEPSPKHSALPSAEVFKALLESWTFHVGYGAKLIVLYLAVNGAVLTFMLDENASHVLFYVLGAAGCLFCVWCHLVCTVHRRAVHEIEDALTKAASAIGIAVHPGTSRHYDQFLGLCMWFNGIIGLSFLAITILVRR